MYIGFELCLFVRSIISIITIYVFTWATITMRVIVIVHRAVHIIIDRQNWSKNEALAIGLTKGVPTNLIFDPNCEASSSSLCSVSSSRSITIVMFQLRQNRRHGIRH